MQVVLHLVELFVKLLAYGSKTFLDIPGGKGLEEALGGLARRGAPCRENLSLPEPEGH